MSGDEGAAAAASAGRVRVLEGEPGPHHRRDVVDLHAVQVLGAERIHEETKPVRVEDLIILLGLILDVEAVLEARAPAGQDRDAQARSLGSALLGHELPHFGDRVRCDRNGHQILLAGTNRPVTSRIGYTAELGWFRAKDRRRPDRCQPLFPRSPRPSAMRAAAPRSAATTIPSGTSSPAPPWPVRTRYPRPPSTTAGSTSLTLSPI